MNNSLQQKNSGIVRYKILVVDDDPATREFLKFVFKEAQYILKEAVNGKEGIQVAREFRPDLILSDVVMPEMDGLAFCQAVRNDEKLQMVIFLLMSSVHLEISDRVDGLRGGADEYLLKPLDENQIKAQVQAFLRIKILQDQLVSKNDRLEEMNTALEENKRKVEETNKALEHEKERLTYSLKEISKLAEELEKSHKNQLQLNITLKESFDDLVALLATIVELRNPYQPGHSKEVAQISMYVGERLELDTSQLKNLRMTALLHEIGMIGLPDDIIKLTPDQMSPEQLKIYLQHPVVGESLLLSLKGCQQMAKIIRHLHENLDGSGFPDKLIGDEIPLESRIIKAAADFSRALQNVSDHGQIYRVYHAMKNESDIRYDARVFAILKDYVDTIADRRKNRKIETISLAHLQPGMVLAADVFTNSGIKLIPEGIVLTEASIKGILNYSYNDPLPPGIKIIVQ
ncbi:MAG: response regulator [Candidatus Marinimicrobia bacterium]|nr:response regulator [Candidatus Neomarinimicrobiota bacterium]MCF7841117.1 response regulator [Candidatus Neomarinimicrobiota bacterium]